MKRKRLRLSVFFVEKEEEELKLQTLNKVEEEGACRVNKLDPK